MNIQQIDKITLNNPVFTGLKSEVERDHITLSTASTAKKLFEELRAHPKAKEGSNGNVLQVMNPIIEPFTRSGVEKIWESDPFTKETARDFLEALSKIADESLLKAILASCYVQVDRKLWVLEKYCVSEFAQDPLRAKPLLDKIERLGTWATGHSYIRSKSEKPVKELIYKELGQLIGLEAEGSLIRKTKKWKEVVFVNYQDRKFVEISAEDLDYINVEFDKLFVSLNMIKNLALITRIIKIIAPNPTDYSSKTLAAYIRKAGGVDEFMEGKIGHAVSSCNSFRKSKSDLRNTLRDCVKITFTSLL